MLRILLTGKPTVLAEDEKVIPFTDVNVKAALSLNSFKTLRLERRLKCDDQNIIHTLAG